MRSPQHFAYVACVALLAPACPLHAQQAAATAGPTLQETVGFINDTYGKQPPITDTVDGTAYLWSDIHAELNGACSMALTVHTKDGTESYEFSLEKADPLSVAVEARTGGFSGFSVTANGVTKSLPIPPTSKDVTQITPESYRGEGYVIGVISSLRPDELEFVSGQGKVYRIRATDTNDITLFIDSSHRSLWHSGEEHNFSHFTLSQRVLVSTHTTTSGKGKKQTEVVTEDVTSYPPTTSYRKVALPPLASNDTANRMAKALIHAIVLCHKDEKPPLF